MSSPDDANPFERARAEWKTLSSERGWFGIFGELYVQRYPFLAGMMHGSAASIKRSLAGDDSVHAFDASGIRRTIISRALETEGRGVIRPWYAQLGFVADSTNFLKGVSEDELDFLVRRSLLDEDNKTVSGLFDQLRADFLTVIDPSLDPLRTAEGTLNQFELEKLIERSLVPAGGPTIEFYAFLVALTNHLFTISPEEIDVVIDILLDPEKADKFLRRRFVDEEAGDYPFVGEKHPRLRTHENMILETFGLGDEEYYLLRVVQLWLYALLRSDRRAHDYFHTKNSLLLHELKSWHDDDPENRHFSQLIQRAILYAKFRGIYARLLLMLKTTYAKRTHYEEYANRLFHLFERREELIEALDELFIPADRDQFEVRNILIEVGLMIMQSSMENLERQIPVPETLGGQEHIQGTIMSRRKANLRKEVLDPVRDELLEQILDIMNLRPDKEGIFQMGHILRQPHIILTSRGETYFKEMKERVQEQLAAMGDLTLSGELQYVTDTPQVLVKQFGKEIYRWAEAVGLSVDKMSPSEIYSGILSLKSAELMFGDATVNEVRKHEITKSLYEDYFADQAQMLKYVLGFKESFDEAETTAETAKVSKPLDKTEFYEKTSEMETIALEDDEETSSTDQSSLADTSKTDVEPKSQPEENPGPTEKVPKE